MAESGGNLRSNTVNFEELTALGKAIKIRRRLIFQSNVSCLVCETDQSTCIDVGCKTSLA